MPGISSTALTSTDGYSPLTGFSQPYLRDSRCPDYTAVPDMRSKSAWYAQFRKRPAGAGGSPLRLATCIRSGNGPRRQPVPQPRVPARPPASSAWHRLRLRLSRCRLRLAGQVEARQRSGEHAGVPAETEWPVQPARVGEFRVRDD